MPGKARITVRKVTDTYLGRKRVLYFVHRGAERMSGGQSTREAAERIARRIRAKK